MPTLLTVAATVALASLSAPVAPASPVGAPAADYRPGATGVGDPYWPEDGNGGYDVAHYDLGLRYTPPGTLVGRAVISARATQDLSRFDLDADGLAVRDVRVDGSPATFALRGGELVVDPAGAGVPAGRDFTVVVRYTATPEPVDEPDQGLAGLFRTPDGFVIAGEPHGASTWFPDSMHPDDKASFRFTVTVPRGLQAVANGGLRRREAGPDTTTFVWSARAPMATYLATVDVGHFQLTRETSGGVRYVYAVDSSLATTQTGRDALRLFRLQPAMVRFLQPLFGRYPFRRAGAIVDNDPGLYFALETQTRPVFGRRFFEGDQLPFAEGTVVHELAHQWFGDDVSVHRWSDIWLNEGFATYAEWLWSEHTGHETAAEQLRYFYDLYDADDPMWQVRIGDPGRAHLITAAIYARGAMTLQVLRERVGDTAFFAILRTWVREHHAGNGSVRQFRALAARVSGQHLGGLFDTWLDRPGRPPAPRSAS